MRLTRYESLSLRGIRSWERRRHEGVQALLMDAAVKPVELVIKSIGQRRLQDCESALAGTVEKLLNASSFTVDFRTLQRRARKHGVTLRRPSDLRRCNLQTLDRCNREHIRVHQRAAAVQGAVLGLGGAAAAVADITVVLVACFKLAQETAFCYGYDPNRALEKGVILKTILAAVGDSQTKFESLRQIDQLLQVAAEEQDEPDTRRLNVLGGRALKEYVERLTICMLIRLVPQMLPVVSAVISAHSNSEMVESTGKAGFMVYRKRFIERKQDLLSTSPPACPD